MAAPSLVPMPLDLAAALSAPLPPEAITPHPTKDYLSSVKAIYVIERLNQVFGLGGWTYRTRVIECPPDSPMVVMLVVLRVPAYGIRLEQYGGSDNKDRGDAYKGAVTDAISKIASYLGIAMDVYKGGGPTKRNPRGTRVTPANYSIRKGPQPAAAPGSSPAQLDVFRASLMPQPAAEMQIPEPEDEDRYTYEQPESELEVQLAESIGIAESRKTMLKEFQQLEKRYRTIAFAPTYGAILGRHCVQTPDQFKDLEAAKECYKEMLGDVRRREAQYAQKWGAK